MGDDETDTTNGLVLWVGGTLIGLAISFGACGENTEVDDARPSGDDVAVTDTARDVLVLPPAPACSDGVGPALGPWIRCAGGPFEDRAFAVAVGPDGALIMAGATFGELRAGEVIVGPRAQASSVVVRYDASGRHLGSRAFGGDGGAFGENDESATAIAVDPSGDLIVAGTFTGRLDLGGGVVLHGEAGSGSGDKRDVYIAKLDPTATTCRWARQVAALGFDAVADLAVDSTGAVYFTGSAGSGTFGPFEHTTQFLLGKIDAGGAEAWLIDEPALERGVALALDAEEHVVVVGFAGRGTVMGHAYNDGDSFIVRVSPAGEVQWASEVEALRGGVSLYGVGATDDGRILVGGITGAGDAHLPGDGVDAGDGVTVLTTPERQGFVVGYTLAGDATSGVLVASAGGLPPGRSFVFDGDGRVAVASRFRGERWLDATTSVVTGPEMALSIATYDAAGTLIWNAVIAAESALGTQPGMIFDHAGALVITGYYPDRAHLADTVIEPFDADLSTDLWLWKVALP